MHILDTEMKINFSEIQLIFKREKKKRKKNTIYVLLLFKSHVATLKVYINGTQTPDIVSGLPGIFRLHELLQKALINAHALIQRKRTGYIV